VVSAVLGQQVSVRGASTLAGRLVARFGTALTTEVTGITHLFPTAGVLARARLEDVRKLGLPGARAQTIVDLARAFDDGAVVLPGEPDKVIAQLTAIRGIGPWTAHYLAMRALHWPDAFPGGDLVVRRALGVTTTRAAEQRAEAWRPWRAYAVLQLWQGEA
jgi:AraC family transcriptional regulator of adaptative response / DNA-3-methyladenine glycosylase II